jgi:hypothetical protein
MATTTPKTTVQAADVIKAHLSTGCERAEISLKEYKKLCKFGDRDPEYAEGFAITVDGERYQVEALTVHRSRARGGDTTTYHISRD